MIPRDYQVLYKRHNVHQELQSKYTFLFLQSNNVINTIFDVLLLLPDKCLNESDPALLAPIIAEKQSPPSKQLFIARKSRFKSGTEDHSDNSSSNN